MPALLADVMYLCPLSVLYNCLDHWFVHGSCPLMLFFMLASSNHACNVIATGLVSWSGWCWIRHPWMDRDSEEPSYFYISSEMFESDIMFQKRHAIGALPLHAL